MHPVRASSSQLITPDEGYIELVRSIAANTLAALGNHVSANAALVAATAVTYTILPAPAITVKSSGKFLVFGWGSVEVNGGTLADGDGVELTPLRGAVALTPLIKTAASTATGNPAGSTIAAPFAFGFIDTSGVAVGSTVTYGIQVTTANGHTSGILANDGFIGVLELPG